MRRQRAAAPNPADEAHHALRSVVAALPDAPPGSALERAFASRDGRARAVLVEAVTEAAFAHAAAARGLVGDPRDFLLGVRGRALHDTWPFGAETFRAVLEAALAALAERREPAAFAALEPDELGAFYEGLLATGVELAACDSVVVAEPRPAGGAPVDRLVALASPRAARAAQSPEPSAARSTKAPRGPRVAAGRVALLDTVARRRSGSHYTPRALTERVVADTLAPLLGSVPAPGDVLALRVCDPAMGTGAFLVAACRYLAERLLEAERRAAASDHAVSVRTSPDHAVSVRASPDHAVSVRTSPDHAVSVRTSPDHAVSVRTSPSSAAALRASAFRRVAERCLFGVDRDELAVGVARQALWLAIEDPALPLDAFDAALRSGDALTAFAWDTAFPQVLAERGGFDAFVGNPPWVSYAGRAAQPLAPAVRKAYARFEAFHGYKNLQGLFVERAARLLRPGGRLGFVLPSSMSELAGYRPTRRAHDRLCAPDAPLPDLGAAAFDGVFQPCMVLRSTRRAEPLASVSERPWPVERPDLDAVARALIAKLARPPLPPELFGERGLQSTGRDAAHLVAAPSERHSVPLRSGSDVEAFGLRAPSAHADPSWFGARLRVTGEWARVRVLVRQTARVPVAALSDGAAFRNSLLAGFEDAEHSADFLVAYLNSTPIRWLHYARHRDARQGMPQLKIAHLRATPAPPTRALVHALAAFGAELSSRGRGIFAKEQSELDALVADAFELDEKERKRLADFRAEVADARPRA